MLTRAEILQEPAGPRLNRWVAEYVMEWNGSQVTDYDDPALYRCRYDFSGRMQDAHIILLAIVHHWKGCWLLTFGQLARAEIVMSGLRRVCTENLGANLPLVICRAALLAVMEGKE